MELKEYVNVDLLCRVVLYRSESSKSSRIVSKRYLALCLQSSAKTEFHAKKEALSDG